jgi:hypothetical protein
MKFVAASMLVVTRAVTNRNKAEIKPDLEARFLEHVSIYGIQMKTKTEYEERKKIFIQTDIEIEAINQEQTSFKLAHNMFSTMTQQEKDKMKGLQVITGGRSS